jgi:hypothetical protein
MATARERLWCAAIWMKGTNQDENPASRQLDDYR